ncbi:MAG: transketolase C-terminal domain-containing protein [Thermovirgaceae bacterium]|nr:transketolase C-terminal domain-containing protein [Thermovirgaceae bacterium]
MRSTLDGFGEGLLELGRQRGDVVVLHADSGESARISPFADAFPERSFNFGISEQDMVMTAAGLSLTGKMPFACSFAAFLTTRAFDQIRTCLAIPCLGAVLVGTHSGLAAGEDGVSHQMNQDIALMRSLPNMSVMIPPDADSAFRMVFVASQHPGPVYLRLGGEQVPDIEGTKEAELRVGGGRLLREGDGVTICACGIMVHEALRAAEILSKQGISAEVIDCFSVKPLPSQLILASLRRTGCCVIAEEHNVIGGLCEAVAGLAAGENPVPMRYVAISDRYGQSGAPQELREYYGLTFREIVGAAAQIWSMRRR